MDLKNYKLNNWNRMTVKADVEEEPEDIKLAIIYKDHGDDFIYVKTKDGEQFLYGYFLGRRCEARDIEDLEREERIDGYSRFLRKPQSFFKYSNVEDETGFDGIAGKRLVSFCPEFDSVIAVYKDGNEVPESEYILVECDNPDEYGFVSYYVPTDQFDDGIEEKLVKEIEERKSELINSLNELDFTGKSLRWLYECEKMLCSVVIYTPVDEEI